MVITIAGGSSTFTAGIVKSIALRRELEVDEIRLFDINRASGQGGRCGGLGPAQGAEYRHQAGGHHRYYQQAYTDASFVFAQMRVETASPCRTGRKDPPAPRLRGTGDLRLRRHGLRNAHHLPHDQADRRRGKVCQEGLLDPELLQPPPSYPRLYRKLRPKARIINICDMPIAIIDVVAAAVGIQNKKDRLRLLWPEP